MSKKDKSTDKPEVRCLFCDRTFPSKYARKQHYCEGPKR